jgi:hypothetical protein
MKTLRSTLVLILAAFSFSVLVAQPAQAAYTDCPANRLCLFDLTGGGTLTWAGYVSPGICHNLPSYANNNASSFYNNLNGLNRAVQFYDQANCQPTLLRRQFNASTGPHFSGAQDNFYRDTLLNHRDRVTSIWFNTCTSGCGSGFMSDRKEGQDLETPIVSCPCRPKP